jgi:hypothetical protein
LFLILIFTLVHSKLNRIRTFEKENSGFILSSFMYILYIVFIIFPKLEKRDKTWTPKLKKRNYYCRISGNISRPKKGGNWDRKMILHRIRGGKDEEKT